MPFTLDASTTLAWFLPDEESPTANEALRRLRDDTALVPSGWSGEVINGFLAAERRARLPALETTQSLAVLREMSIQVVATDLLSESLLDLARMHNLTAYAAAYLELAVREGTSLATLDDELARAARSVGVAIVGEM